MTLKDTAVLSDANAPTGSITFDLSQKTTFEGHIIFTSIDTETMTVSGNGTYTTPTGYTLPTTGNVVDTYRWDARYSGDSNNASVSATEEQLDVVRARPSLSTTPNPKTVTLDASSVTLPDSLEDSAVLSGYFPTGTITFTLYSGTTLLDTEPVSVSGNGTYTTRTATRCRRRGRPAPTSGTRLTAGTTTTTPSRTTTTPASRWP